jgi:DNA-binding GntR family transcriptional regulator
VTDSLFGLEEPLVTKPFREIIYERLRKAILSGDLPQGEHFKDTDLAAKFDVSRMPVREALRRLEAEGLIRQIPMKGFVVVELTPQDAADIFSVRKSLEGLAAAYACRRIAPSEIEELKELVRTGRLLFAERGETLSEEYGALTRRFSRKFIDACRVPRLIRMVWHERELLERFHVVDRVLERRGERLLDDRQALVDAFEARDERKARSVWEEHLESSLQAYFESLGWAEPPDHM